MGRLVIASQLNAAFNATLAEHVADAEIVSLPPGPPTSAPRGAEILFAAPFRKAGGAPPEPPPGWPFDLRWVQLLSVGIDFYPPWLFDGLTVTSARGSSSVALAEFTLASIFAAAKRQNHGILTVAASVEGAVWRYLALENAFQVQLLAEAAGPTRPMPDAVARHTAGQIGSEVGAFHAFQPYWDVVSEDEPDLFD
jgi:phosphoglycerate dehydrogenase-like enzyme